jgi:hypothetical protein
VALLATAASITLPTEVLCANTELIDKVTDTDRLCVDELKADELTDSEHVPYGFVEELNTAQEPVAEPTTMVTVTPAGLHTLRPTASVTE